MPTRTINQGFNTFHSWITPSSYQSGKASSHKSSITTRLEAYYDLNQLFYSGSAKNGTDISDHSDVDFFASIPTKNLKHNSSTSLREIKECLQDRFTSTSVYVDSPAVVLDFGSGTWDTAEVIPAGYVEKTGKEKNVYNIPDGSGGWMRSSPSTHNSYVTLHNNRLNKKLKPLIRFVKAWKYYCDVPISSFYIELRVTKLMETEESIVYEIDLNTIFQKLLSTNLAAIQDPEGVSGLIYPCKSDVAKATALSKLSTAASRIQKAREAESAGNIKEAFEWWNKVFSNRFPNYIY
ncbi:nucleotidyltransferase [Vibrio parahaemolyticus]|nr:nucleotidyltransferase [Vibrio parahaemolyticus]HCH1219459.1 nucleotidyltransferase [Vibrio parahaemolyticus]